jgi:RNA polymerase sigma-70 factor (ECF subfamily)
MYDTHTTEEVNALMPLVIKGDPESFEELVRLSHNMVFNLARNILRDYEDAEEITQDTFLKLFRARDSFDLTKRVEPWLAIIVGNAARDRLRRRKVRLIEIPASRMPDEFYESLDYQDPSLRETPDFSLSQELNKLNSDLRDPLELKYISGMTLKDIAHKLKMSASTVKLKLKRGKAVLTSRLRALREKQHV